MIIPRYYNMLYMFYVEQFAIRLINIYKDICHMATSHLSEANHGKKSWVTFTPSINDLYMALDIKMLLT